MANAKRPVGRPSEYDPSFVTAVDEYLAKYNQGDEPEAVPTTEGYCDFIGGVAKSTLMRWAEAHEELRNALECIKTKQGKLLQSGGLKGTFAPVITKLMLSANHGMAEKQITAETTVDELIKSQEGK